uniref:Uncharacterized protein n=1 Tax=Anguilla anguilla TaxID=7936 RepID=A0A0E9T6C1_ANGAN
MLNNCSLHVQKRVNIYFSLFSLENAENADRRL